MVSRLTEAEGSLHAAAQRWRAFSTSSVLCLIRQKDCLGWIWDELNRQNQSFRVYTELGLSHVMRFSLCNNLSHSVALLILPTVSSYIFCGVLWDITSLSDVHFEFIQPFFCHPEREMELLFPSFLLTLCWFGKWTYQSSLHPPPQGIPLFLVSYFPAPTQRHIYPQLHLFISLCDQLQEGVLILPCLMLLDDNFCQDQMFAWLLIRESHKPKMTPKLQAEAGCVKKQLWDAQLHWWGKNKLFIESSELMEMFSLTYKEYLLN